MTNHLVVSFSDVDHTVCLLVKVKIVLPFIDPHHIEVVGVGLVRTQVRSHRPIRRLTLNLWVSSGKCYTK